MTYVARVVTSQRPRAVQPVALTSVVALAALVLTAGVAVLPFTRFAYRAPVLHVVLETTEGCIALAVAYLLFGRYRRTRGARPLLVTYALVVVAVANLGLQAIPQAVGDSEVTPWAPLAVRLLGVVLLTAAALTPAPVQVGPVAARAGLVAAASAVVVLWSTASLLGNALPPIIAPGGDLGEARVPPLAGHPLALAAQALSGVLYGVAAVAFTRAAARDTDELQRWLGAGCALAAVARVNYLLFPSLYSDYVYTGDLLRLGFYLCLLIGAMREVRSYWESLSYTAVLEDRRRLARDLHDGLTQELTYLWSQSQRLASHPGDTEAVERINGASARALDEARTAIAALTRTTTGSYVSVLRESVEGLAGRYGADAVVEADDAVEMTPAQGDAVLRIVAEAFRNAVRHGAASCVRVTLTGPPLALVVRDDGQGFDPSGANNGAKSGSSGGFGLVSMRERADGLGAAFELRSQVGQGTVVEVRWP